MAIAEANASLADSLAYLNLLIAIIGVLFVALAVWEFAQLRGIRKDFNAFQKQFKANLYRMQKAQQRVIASYQVSDLDQRISLLRSAVAEDPNTFNGFNALGYAYLDNGDEYSALDAFKEATVRNPGMKEGYFDLAGVYKRMGRDALAQEQIRKAIKHDPTAREDALNDPRFRDFV